MSIPNPLLILAGLILPRVCHICERKLSDSERFICSSCAGALPATHYETYWTNTSGLNTDLNPMEQRFAGQIPLHHACAPYFYSKDSALASLIHDFKYRGFSRLATELGRQGAESLKSTGLFDGVDILLPVPLHRSKLLRRGYNQSEMLARGVSQATGIPLGKNLYARKAHRTQTSLSAEQRLANTRDVFAVKQPEALKDRHVMLIDDICTTGATLLAAGRALLDSSPGISISIFTLGVV